MAVTWEATDQFGNMYIASSSATSVEELQPEFADMIIQVKTRTPGEVRFSIDPSYNEVSAPKSDPVTHVLNIAWMENLPNAFELISAALQHAISESGYTDIVIQGPWD